MKKGFPIFFIIWLFLLFGIFPGYPDNIMMCTFFQNPVARVYKVSDEGDISFDYNSSLANLIEKREKTLEK